MGSWGYMAGYSNFSKDVNMARYTGSPFAVLKPVTDDHAA